MKFFEKFAFFVGMKKREANVLVIGLDNSGKSTLLSHFKSDSDRSPDVVPTVGFNVGKFKSMLLVMIKYAKLFRYINIIDIAVSNIAIFCTSVSF